jgi:hypothetical protein
VNRLEATITLLPTAEGGYRDPIPAPTQSLILIFGGGTVPVGHGAIGARIYATDREAFVPGAQDIPVWIEFWAEKEALALVAEGRDFRLWAGRVIGSGRIS